MVHNSTTAGVLRLREGAWVGDRHSTNKSHFGL